MITEHRNDRCLVTGLGFSCGHSRSSKPIVSIGSGSLANDERTIIHETRPPRSTGFGPAFDANFVFSINRSS